MNEKQYYKFGRENILWTKYIDIAMQHYATADERYQEIKRLNFNLPDCMYLEEEMESNILVTVVFAAMCMESFINDYAAACLDDDYFYDNYEKLDLIAKIELIFGLVFQKRMNRSAAYFCLAKRLIKQRNEFVHNKSKKSKFVGYTKEEYLEMESQGYLPLIEDLCIDAAACKTNIKLAFDALRAVLEIAREFDKNDNGVFAEISLFSFDQDKMQYGDDYYFVRIARKLGVKEYLPNSSG